MCCNTSSQLVVQSRSFCDGWMYSYRYLGNGTLIMTKYAVPMLSQLAFWNMMDSVWFSKGAFGFSSCKLIFIDFLMAACSINGSMWLSRCTNSVASVMLVFSAMRVLIFLLLWLKSSHFYCHMTVVGFSFRVCYFCYFALYFHPRHTTRSLIASVITILSSAG